MTAVIAPDLPTMYKDYLGDGPPRRGHGPWWVVVVFNIAPGARQKTDILFHSSPALQLAVANRVEKGFSKWVPAIEIGPFRYERAAAAFFDMLCINSSKERISRILWSLVLFDIYNDELHVELNICDTNLLTLTDDDVERFKQDRAEAMREKRGRHGDLYSRRNRIWDMSPTEQRRVTCGSLSISRAIREKIRRSRNRK